MGGEGGVEQLPLGDGNFLGTRGWRNPAYRENVAGIVRLELLGLGQCAFELLASLLEQWFR